MNQDQFEGAWQQMKGKAREAWGKLTDDDIEQVQGKMDVLSGKLQRAYGRSKEEAEKEIDHFFQERS